MSTSAIAASGKEFRHTREFLYSGIGLVLFWLAVGFALFVFSYFNPDGSIPNQFLFDAVVSTPCLLGALGGVAAIAAWRRHRLFVSPELVRVTGIFGAREVRLAEVEKLSWEHRTAQGWLILSGPKRRVRVWFGNYPKPERDELARFFHEALADRPSQGWELFETSWLIPPSVDDCDKAIARTRRERRFVAVAFALMLPLAYAIMITEKMFGGLDHMSWAGLALIPPAMCGFLGGVIWVGLCVVDRQIRRQREEAARESMSQPGADPA
jgi:hypothetical protein